MCPDRHLGFKGIWTVDTQIARKEGRAETVLTGQLVQGPQQANPGGNQTIYVPSQINDFFPNWKLII